MNDVLKDKIDIFLLKRHGITGGVYKNIHDYKISTRDFLSVALDREGKTVTPLEFISALEPLERRAWAEGYMDGVFNEIKGEFSLSEEEEEAVAFYLADGFRLDLTEVVERQTVCVYVTANALPYVPYLDGNPNDKGKLLATDVTFCLSVSMYGFVKLLNAVHVASLYDAEERYPSFYLMPRNTAYVFPSESSACDKQTGGKREFHEVSHRTGDELALFAQDIVDVHIAPSSVRPSDFMYMEV